MRKVMIVDDESLVRVGFQTIIDWEAHGYQISGLHKNGLQAWEAIQIEGPPDVLLTDIKMPEMDGLELIRHIREQNMDCNIIILSSHDEFTYLRASIKLRVQDYILKHTFEPDELIQTLNKLDYSVYKEGQSKLVNIDIEKEQRLLLQESRIESHFLIREKEINIDRFPSLVKKWGIKDAQGYWISIRAYPRENPYFNSELTALNYQLQELIERFSSIVYVGMDQQTIHAFYRIDSESNPLNKNIFDKWSTSVLQKLDIPIVIGLSKRNSLSSGIMRMRIQAETAINKSFYFGEGVYLCDKDNPIERISVIEWAKLKESALEILTANEITSIYNWMDNIGNQFAQRFVPQEEAIRFLHMVYRSFLESQMEIYLLKKEEMEDGLHSSLVNYEDAIVNSNPTWKEVLKTTCKMMQEKDEKTLKKIKSPWLEVVIKYIKEHYTEPIRLEDVASLANFNENYFSLLFRNEMGITFLEYVTRLRIEKAIQLMKDTSLSTEEVSFQVGYPNGNYFVKVFKKVTGITVSQYRSNPNSLIKSMKN
ncbi:response regulator transcription factor [Metabacillus bambusae]|uniref:Response regulator n=1 Tax=Metabacillus bambusae TaxID=2795218 RepID=A0ABS3MZS8_9BACI|nr:response regulator [Metabacillus bambusae]MBO1511536.1 response regulator [Metabacillus bambusae]